MHVPHIPIPPQPAVAVPQRLQRVVLIPQEAHPPAEMQRQQVLVGEPHARHRGVRVQRAQHGRGRRPRGRHRHEPGVQRVQRAVRRGAGLERCGARERGGGGLRVRVCAVGGDPAAGSAGR